ncbi:hypothetical protein X798_04994 [Onchocerca flexuosa]|uniref:Uncharacterized protein n=1 Tax=Onchocerca flexuosa TaxID=387005 RepID=A0A238BTV4_9BILA|nr:hypothetical protein X798_04994 [Onchocerca flexuosa]
MHLSRILVFSLRIPSKKRKIEKIFCNKMIWKKMR